MKEKKVSIPLVIAIIIIVILSLLTIGQQSQIREYRSLLADAFWELNRQENSNQSSSSGMGRMS